MPKLAIGTVQFGLDYGINNVRGKIPLQEVFSILDRAVSSGIDMLDTAYDYGDSEKVLGQYLIGKGKDFKIISKLPKGKADEMQQIPEESLEKMGIQSFYGYLAHDFETFKRDPDVWSIIKKLKTDGKTRKIGFSLYFPQDLEALLQQGIELDMVQVPYNIFDRRFEPLFPRLKDKGVEIHVRSVFLQGLVFKPLEDLEGVFVKLKDKFAKMDSFVRDANLSRLSLCLNFVRSNKFIDRIVVGVDSLDNLVEIIGSVDDFSRVKSIQESFAFFVEEDLNILLPFRWTQNAAVETKRS